MSTRASIFCKWFGINPDNNDIHIYRDVIDDLLHLVITIENEEIFHYTFPEEESNQFIKKLSKELDL